MKRVFIIAMLACCAIAGWAQENNYTIKADVSGLIKYYEGQEKELSDSVYLLDCTTQKPITEKVVIKDATKVELCGYVDSPKIIQLMILQTYEGWSRNLYVPLFLEPGNIVIDAKAESPEVVGTPLNNVFFTCNRKIIEASKNGNLEMAAKYSADYVLEHKDGLSAVLMLYSMRNKTDAEAKNLLNLIEQCGENVRQHPLTSALVKKLNHPLVGDMFKDFSVEYDGKTTRLSDYVGKGKYVLVDFWASWCGPCRAEIPNLIKAYEQYKDKGFMVLGVAVNDKHEDTLKAIEKDGITYPQILNSEGIAASTYGFNAIPYIVLFGPDGTILSCELRGDAIKAKLAEIFDK
jgi:thiol-disulfide isomerase/thioredoxin